MQLMTRHRSRAAVGLATVAAVAAGTALLATPAAADPADGIRCSVGSDRARSQLDVYCYDDVAGRQATIVDYQWERDGVAVPGATASTFPYQKADEGHLFSATVGVERDGTTVTIPVGRASAPQHQALFLMNGCDVQVSQRFGNPGGRNLLDGADLNDTLTLTLDTEIASNLTVSGPYWTMTTSSGAYALPPALAGQGQGWTVTLSDLASIDAILEPGAVHGRGWAEVSNSFTVSGGEVSATAGGCPWGPDTPMGLLNDGVFVGTSPRTPAFPIAEHAAGDTGVQGVLTANTSGWAPKDAPDAVTFTYQWTRDGQRIDGAVSDSYTLTAEDSGKKIGLVIWGTVDIWGAVDPTTAWIWGEVTAGEIKAPAATTSPTASASAAAGSGQTSTATSTAAVSDATTPSSLASTGSTVLPVVIAAVLLLAAGAVALVVRRRAHQLG